MAGWDKTSGELKDNSGEALFSHISASLYLGSHNTTYKFCFFKSLLDNVINASEDLVIDLKDISNTFAEVYWNLVTLYNIPIHPKSASSMENLIRGILAENPLLLTRFESLRDDLKEEYLRKTYPIFKKYVVGAFYDDVGGYLYGFDIKNGTLWLNATSQEFLLNNKTLLENLNYYEWLKMVERILKNQSLQIGNLSTLLEDVTKRTNLEGFKQELLEKGDHHDCFYCGHHLPHASPLDHLVPWSFLKRDNLWDLVFACSSCNSSKNDRLPVDLFVNKLIYRNRSLSIDGPDILRIVKIAKYNGVRTDWRPSR